MDGQYLHRDIIEMAAAYGFHLCQDHPFLDGNKRIALVAMDTFLQLNGMELLAGVLDALSADANRRPVRHSTYLTVVSS